MATLGKPSPKDDREWTIRLTFNWRCVECGYTWSGPVNDGFHCGQYADDADELEDAEMRDPDHAYDEWRDA